MRIPGIVLGILVGSITFGVHMGANAQSRAPAIDEIISLR